MIDSPFLEEVHSCKGVMKKLRKKIYKFNINHLPKNHKVESTIKDALTLLEKRTLPQFLINELQKYSDLTFSSLSGFSLSQVTPMSQIAQLANNQEQEIYEMYHKNKRTIKRRRSANAGLKLHKRQTEASEVQLDPISSTNISDMFDDEIQNESSGSEEVSEEFFEPINSGNDFEQEFNNSDAMFQSTMLDFNEIEMDSEEFLFKCWP